MSATQAPNPPFGQVLALAHRAMTKPLIAALAEVGTPTSTWYAMRIIALRGPAIERVALEAELGTATEIDAATSGAIVDQLLADGIVALDAAGEVTLTERGEARFAALRETVAGLTSQLQSTIDPTDIETTTRVLQALTARAEELAA